MNYILLISLQSYDIFAEKRPFLAKKLLKMKKFTYF